MGWTISYRASGAGNIEEFVASANQAKLPLSEGCEPYKWAADGTGAASGFSKVGFDEHAQANFALIAEELKRLSAQWPRVHLEAIDDYVLGDWTDVRTIDLDKLFES